MSGPLYVCHGYGKVVLRDDDDVARFMLEQNGGGYTERQTADTMIQLRATRECKTYTSNGVMIDRLANTSHHNGEARNV